MSNKVVCGGSCLTHRSAALNGARLTWFDTYQYFLDSAPNVHSIQTATLGLDPGTNHAIWQLGSCERRVQDLYLRSYLDKAGFSSQ